ncbi:MAG: hydrogenase maturation protease [Planctomycetota bacterium]|jgi:hydrogenase maturation protease
MKRTLVICLGNPLMRDEGVGIRLARELGTCLVDNPDVEVMDLGTGGLSVMYAMAGRERVVFVDCALMGQSPGSIRCFTPDQVRSKKVRMRYSLHEGDLLNTIELSERMGECPEDIVVFGIEPKDIFEGEGLSPELEGNVKKYVDRILEELGTI